MIESISFTISKPEHKNRNDDENAKREKKIQDKNGSSPPNNS